MLATKRWRHGLAAFLGMMTALAPAHPAQSEGAENAPPKSTAAVAALAKRDAAVEKAQAAFAAAKAAADKQYLDDLSNAMKLAMKAGNLEEAKRIDAERTRMDSGKPGGDVSEVQPPKTIPATTAKTRHDAALNKAEATLRSARILAAKQYRSDLATPLREAMTAADLDEAKRLDAARKAVDSEIAELERGTGLARLPSTVTNTLGMKLVRIEAGTFKMGSPETEEGREKNETLHTVKITKPFFMAATTVTQAQWRALMVNNPSNSQGENRPVEKISFDDAMAFCEKLGAKEGKHYRLPTEAEWEYACRAGTQAPFGFASGRLDDYAWYSANSGRQTHDVATRKPNAWGLYDMHGNVYQWCSDGYGPYGGDAVDPKGAADAPLRVIRGGASGYGPNGCRAACRRGFDPTFRNTDVGFRVCLDP